MFDGFTVLGDMFTGLMQVQDATGLPINPDAAPTYRVYGASGVILGVGGTTAPGSTGVVTGATNATPIVIQSVSHGLQTGTRVTTAAIGGNGAANGTFTITRVDGDRFSLNGSTGNGVYSTGGTWSVAGLFRASFSASGASGFEEGENYWLIYTWTEAGLARSQVHTFGVT